MVKNDLVVAKSDLITPGNRVSKLGFKRTRHQVAGRRLLMPSWFRLMIPTAAGNVVDTEGELIDCYR